jgi:hypothetical protein
MATEGAAKNAGEDADDVLAGGDCTDMRSWLLDALAWPLDATDPGPLEGTLRMTCKLVGESNIGAVVDEETMTGMLLGAFAANFPWSVAALGRIGVAASWARYRKGGRRFDSESQTGGDFALVIEIPGDSVKEDDRLVRIAIFQAKKISGGAINLHHVIKPRPSHPEDKIAYQLPVLATHAKTFVEGSGEKFDVAKVGWVHHLAYGEGNVHGIALRHLTSHLASYSPTSSPKSLPLRVDINSNEWRALSDILVEGCALGESLDPFPKWLTLPRNVAARHLGDLLEVMDVAVGDTTGEGRPPLFKDALAAFRINEKRRKQQARAAPAKGSPAASPSASKV